MNLERNKNQLAYEWYRNKLKKGEKKQLEKILKLKKQKRTLKNFKKTLKDIIIL